jgi:serine/threonine protein kinase/Tol biopolymer transport system component
VTPERWREITEIFHAARQRDGSQRQAFLADACQGDGALRQDVEAMLAGDTDASWPDETPPLATGSLGPGTSFGVYRIEQLLGRGGMGEVYRARDTTLGREVAIKVLPAAWLADPGRLERLQREARVLAALNHPNIATLYGVEQMDGVYGLILELAEGPTLADRIARGPMPLDEVLPIARQIAEALAAAHERGIVHRDVKPSNITVSSQGVVKVLDFGLAKTAVGDPLYAGTQSPTMAAMTGEGVIVGTVAYMSPEQARGHAVDRRTDVWAFGCVLFEMLSGRQVFGGDTASDALAAILEREPPWDRLSPTTPPSLHRLLRRCLAKDPQQRLRDVGDAQLDLDEARMAVPSPAGRLHRPGLVPWIAATLVVAAAAMIAGWYLRGRDVHDTRVPVSIRFAIPSSREAMPVVGFPLVSPDGRLIAFVAKHNGIQKVWVRSLEAEEAHPVSGSDYPYNVFWSPDSQRLGFASLHGLMVADPIGGEARSLGLPPLDGPWGSMWTRDGRIVGGTFSAGMFAVSASGAGQPTQLTQVDAAHGEFAQMFPTLLPDGRHFLYLSEPAGMIRLASLDSRETTGLLRADSQALYAPPGYLLFVRRQTLFAQPFDADHLRVSGEPVSIAESVMTEQLFGADFGVSANGVLAYRTGTIHAPTQLRWVDRTGKPLEAVGPPGRYANLELSPDGTRVVLDALNTGTYTKDIFVMDLGRGALLRLTSWPGNATFPIWSPDGQAIIYASDRDDGFWRLYRRRADGGGGDERVTTTSDAMRPLSWSPDGQSVLYESRALGVLPLVGVRTPRAFDKTVPTAWDGQVSADGHWVAYAADEAGGISNIHVQSYPSPGGGKWQASTGVGGIAPRWRHDGRELYYYSADGSIMSVPVTRSAPLELGTPVPLFKANLLGGVVPGIPWRMQYAVASDGQRFLLNEPLEDPYANAPITVVTNWTATLKK